MYNQGKGYDKVTSNSQIPVTVLFVCVCVCGWGRFAAVIIKLAGGQ